jgi:hypothetical protein
MPTPNIGKENVKRREKKEKKLRKEGEVVAMIRQTLNG